MPYTQENRLIAIDTPLGEDVLLLQGFTGHEAISRLFSFQLDLLSEKGSISFKDIIGQSVTIRVTLADGTPRYFNGVVSRFAQSGPDLRFTRYQMEVVPWLWFLTRIADCRIFQNMTIPDIIKKVFSSRGFSDFKDSLTGTYDQREYCVQYRETDFNFVSRLMEQYGIFYFFQHDDRKHTLVLADAASAHQPCPGQPTAQYNLTSGDLHMDDVVTGWHMEQELRTGKYSLSDYNFETPSTSLLANEPTIVSVNGNSKFEIFDYPGEYLNKSQGDSLAKTRMQEEEATHLVASGSSVCRAFTCGYKFELQDYYRDDMNDTYVLTEVQHVASMGESYTTGEVGAGPQYSNHFTCIPASVPFRPPRVTPKPFVQGPQTALVVGKSGEEIWVDKYGRVKVQFFWDRQGKDDENSSCWVRVAQLWAGNQWGAMFIPRISQEVIVDFLEGDPDRPIITGRVYNGDSMPPYTLPGEQTKSTIKSYSSKGGGGFNEIRLEDKKGSEQVFIHGEKDLDVRIKNDRREWIGQDRHLIVKRDKFEQIERDQQDTIKRDHIEQIGRDHHLSIQGKDAIQVSGSHSFAVQGDVIEQFTGNHSEQVTQNYYVKGMNVVIEGMTGLTIKVGGSFVNINPAGVQIVGPMVMINSGGAALSGTPGSLVSPISPAEAQIADNADPGSTAPSYKSQQAAMSAAAAAVANAPSHDPNAPENKDKTHWIEVQLVDDAGKPVTGRQFEVKLPDGSYYTGTTDEKGKGRVENIDPGSCEISFPDLDQDAWEPS